MTERTDHAALALRIIESDRDSSFGWETADAQHLANIAEAQVHATLALVEQQRIANLFMLHAMVPVGNLTDKAREELDKSFPLHVIDWEEALR